MTEHGPPTLVGRIPDAVGLRESRYVHSLSDPFGISTDDESTRRPQFVVGLLEVMADPNTMNTKSLSVLLVENNNGSRESVRLNFESCFTVRRATRALDALELLSSHKPDCLVVEHDFPEMPGLELVRKARERFPHLPIVLLVENWIDMLPTSALCAQTRHVLVRSQLNDRLVQLIVCGAIEQSRLQRDLELQTARLEQSNRDLRQFAYVVSHDLKEPLRMISGYMSLVERRYSDRLDQEGREFVEFACDGATRAQKMIDSLLALSRVDSREMRLAPVETGPVIRSALQALSIVVNESGARIECDSMPRVFGDVSQLGQLFQNLIANAIKFRGSTSPAIRIAAQPAGPNWHFSIRDNGIGIAKDSQKRIFEIFQRLHTQEEYDGIGVGLAVCKRIVERHQGTIWVESSPGEGATFHFTIPAAEQQHSAVDVSDALTDDGERYPAAVAAAV
jgi:signal transduction histidine kinase